MNRGVEKLKIVPHGINEIIETYGNPDADYDFLPDDEFLRNRTEVVSLPFPMRLSWNPDQRMSRIRVHIHVWDSMEDALEEILNYRGYDYLEENKFDYCGGVYNFRKMRAYNALSFHSWAGCIDLNPHIAPLGEKGDQPDFIVKAFERRNWIWGGRWSDPYRPDPMHFQTATGY